MQKTAKVLLKIGIAKAVGGVLLGMYIGLKYAYMLQETGSSSKSAMKLCVIYLGGSALVDILYSILAFTMIKKTKSIARILRRKKSTTISTYDYVMTPSSERSSSGSNSSSGSCSEEDTLETSSHNSI